MYTNVLQYVGDVLQQRSIDPKTITRENFTPTTVIVSGKSVVLETFEGYEHYMKAIQADSESEYDENMKKAIEAEATTLDISRD
ncbi:MAG: hypothetical protein CMQ41_07695 [Gammaproteobacteria bacterium]|nr:hypothetical protein [Gammaproteobacteria bacterium]|tara:strand:- start:869 stop:1120 length:252 start_codon:yes stop_codon:yes gene_type:complete